MVAAPSILDTPPSAFAHTPGVKRDTWFEPWSEHGWLCLTLASSGFDTLGDWLVASVETELLRLGAVPRPDYVSSGFKALLEDQVYRVRMLGFQGLALQLPSLAPWGNDGVLSLQFPSDGISRMNHSSTAGTGLIQENSVPAGVRSVTRTLAGVPT